MPSPKAYVIVYDSARDTLIMPIKLDVPAVGGLRFAQGAPQLFGGTITHHWVRGGAYRGGRGGGRHGGTPRVLHLDETAQAAAVREALEESNNTLQLNAGILTLVQQIPVGTVIYYFYYTTNFAWINGGHIGALVGNEEMASIAEVDMFSLYAKLAERPTREQLAAEIEEQTGTRAAPGRADFDGADSHTLTALLTFYRDVYLPHLRPSLGLDTLFA